MDGSRKHMDKIRVLTAKLADWISCHPNPPVIYCASHQARSLNTPSPYMCVLYQDGKVCDWWELGGVRCQFPADHLVMLSTHLGSRSSELHGQERLWSCAFTLADWKEYPELLRLYRWAPQPVRSPSRLRHAYREVSFQYLMRRQTQGLFLKAALLQFFAVVLDEMKIGNDTQSPVLSQSTEKAVQFLQANYYKPQILLPSVASAAGLSVHHFERVFKRQMGLAPMKYLQSLRIFQSQRLLTSTDLSVKEIALEVGLPDPLYFSRIFHGTTGASPRQYRLQRRFDANKGKC
jgi:AraC-like DNA-binding protein